MQITEYIQRQVAAQRRILDQAIADTSPQMVNHKVGEHCNTIAAVYAHVIGGEDYFVNVCIGGGQRIWEANGWGERLGIPHQLGRDWTIEFPDLGAFQEYAQAVHVSTDACVAGLKAEDLDRIVSVFGNERPVANVLITLNNHASSHAGEIATLKGVQGVKGLPF
jgi:uncharacterized damage-inducible protein DinB